jgi:hypothetical protein
LNSVYARWTGQNHPWGRGGHGRYRFVLARGLETRTLPEGAYRLVVRACDNSGNAAQASRRFTVGGPTASSP